MNKYKVIASGIIIVFILMITTIVFYYIKNESLQEENKTSTHNISALTDSVYYYKNKQGNTVAQVKTYQATSALAFTKNTSNDEQIQKLTELIKQYKSQLETGSSATVFSSSTKVNATSKTIVSDSSHFPTYTSNIVLGKWVQAQTIANKDSTHLTLFLIDEYDVVIRMAKGETFADVITHNPYNKVSQLRALSVQIPKTKPKKIGLGLQIGYGVTKIENNIKTAPYLGVGISYNLIRL